MKDSLWSLDLFRCESIALQTYWVLVVMDQYTRRIIGFGIQRGVVDGLTLCRMFMESAIPLIVRLTPGSSKEDIATITLDCRMQP